MNEHEEGLLLSSYLDEELGAEERARVEAHVASCRACGLELDSLRRTKRTLAAAPRRAMPPELIASLEARLGEAALPVGHSWTAHFRPWLALPQVWVPAGALASAALLVGLWLGLKSNDPDQYVPLEPLLAAHSRYSAESLVPQGSLVASNYSSQLTADYGEAPDQEAE